MPPKKLILVDGISTVGKSTTAQFICMHLKKTGRDPRWYFEHEEPSVLGPPFEDFNEVNLQTQLLHKLETFCGTITNDNRTSVTEALFQNSVFGLLQFGFDESQIRDYISNTLQILDRTDSCIIYLDYKSTDREMMSCYAERRVTGERLDRLCDIMLNNPYCRRNDLSGFEGVVSYWKYINSFLCEAFEAAPMEKIRIEVERDAWAKNEGRLLTFLELPASTKPSLKFEQVSLLKGDYSCDYNGAADQFQIAYDGHDLYLVDFPWNRGAERNPTYRLLRYEGLIFLISGLPFAMSFAYDSVTQKVTSRRVPVFGNSETLDQVFEKIE